MFPWQYISESTLMQNQAIQLSNGVTVTLFLNQSSQNLERFLEMIITISAQNFSRIQCFILPWQHILWRVLFQIGSSKSVMTSCDVIFQSISTKFCNFVCYTKKHLYAKFEQNRIRNKEVARNKKWHHCDVISKNSSAIFLCEYFLLIPIDVPSFKFIEGQLKELQGMVPNRASSIIFLSTGLRIYTGESKAQGLT